MNSQLKSLILMGILGIGVIGLYNYTNREEKTQIKVINSNNYASTLSQEERTKLDGITSASIVTANYISEYIPKGFSSSSQKKALVVVGEPRKNSIMYDMAYTTMRYLEESGIEVELRDLYTMNWNPVLHPDEFYSQKDGIGATPEDAAREQELIKRADYVIFIYPNWHDTANSIVKGYQERVFAQKFAYEITSEGHRGLLKGKGIFTVMNCGYLGGGRGFIGDGVGIEDEKWDRYMRAYEVFDEDLAQWWGMENLGRFVNDRYPKPSSPAYKEELEKLREDLREYLSKTF
jgi:NAD(P)H dehydrogenase (quinone)